MKGSIVQRSPGTWSVRFDVPGPDGRRRQKRVTYRGTKKQAQGELARLLHELNTGAFVEPSRTTVSGYLTRWLEGYAKTSVSAKSYERYADIALKHLVPALGQYTLSRLQPLHIQNYYAQALQTGRRDGRGGLAPQTVLHHHRVLREALQQAVKWQLLVRNPADSVQPPRVDRRERPTLDRDGLLRLLDTAAGTRLYVPCLLAAFGGLRRGEILGVRWEDLDLQAGTLSVRQSLEETRASGLAFKSPKTARSRRTVALPDLVVRELQRHKSAQALERLRLGPAYEFLGLVVALEDGRPYSPHLLSKDFPALVRRAGVAAVTFHDLRHTHATLLLQANVHPKIVSERLGHSTVGLTLDTYSHVVPGLQEDAARKLDAAFGAAFGCPARAG